jgi:hypothetical protein
MPSPRPDAADLAGQVIGNGHCVAYVRRAAGLPRSTLWRRGEPVRGAECEKGTPIATFTSSGTYGSRTDGSSHCAILVAEQLAGLLVWDQWVGQPVHQRLIRFKSGVGPACDDADRYHVIEVWE